MAKHWKPEPKCTANELEQILTFSTGGLQMMPSREMDEVYPGIYIGDASSARLTDRLKSLNITHVLNTAKGNKDVYHVNTDPDLYRKAKISYLAIEATDIMSEKLYKHFEKTSDFLEEALVNEGKALVHCREGFSRSATIVIAFLMIKRKLTAQVATRMVREQREIGPNEGFLQQLCELNEQLWSKGHFNVEPEENT